MTPDDLEFGPDFRDVPRFAVRLIAWIFVVLALCLAFEKADAGDLYLELGVGHDFQVEHGNPQSVIRGRYEMQTPGWVTPDVLEWSHHSSIANGRPFNSRPEETVDQVSVIWRFKLF